MGDTTVTEIRFRLGKLGLCLKDDKVWTMENAGDGYEHLLEKKTALEMELQSVLDQIKQIEDARALAITIREPLDETAVYSAWKEGGSFEALAKKFNTRPDLVSEICWSRLEEDCLNDKPPVLSRKVERHLTCTYCGGRFVARYHNVVCFPKCPSCGRKSSNPFG